VAARHHGRRADAQPRVSGSLGTKTGTAKSSSSAGEIAGTSSPGRTSGALYSGAARGVIAGEAQLTGATRTRASSCGFAEDGVTFDLFLDKTTALPVKVVRKPYNDTITLEPGDWRAVRAARSFLRA
jgi:hypothetical protein